MQFSPGMQLNIQNTLKKHNQILIEEIETDYFSFHPAAERPVPKFGPRPRLWKCSEAIQKRQIRRDKCDKSQEHFPFVTAFGAMCQ